jgi:hypothetical protein
VIKPIYELSSADIKAMIKKLDTMEGDLARKFRQRVRDIAKPIEAEIKRLIPNEPPLSGMGYVIKRENQISGSISYSTNEGRLNWQGTGKHAGGSGKNKGPKATSIRTGIRESRFSLTTSIAKIILESPAVSMADMAGRGPGGRNGKRTNAYPYRKRNGEIIMRRHMINGQGTNLINKLRERYGSASRFGWRALEGKIDETAREIDKIIQEYLDKAWK